MMYGTGIFGVTNNISVTPSETSQNMNKIAYFEVCQKNNSGFCSGDIREMTESALKECTRIPLNTNILAYTEMIEGLRASDELRAHAESIVCTINEGLDADFIETALYKNWKIYVYSLSQEGSAAETLQHDSEELSVALHIILPAVEFKGLWESLYYDTDIKNNLLNFIETTMIFSDKKVDPNIICWNKVILLHGPPGTGKTSLCKALAQKAAIRLGDRYNYVELIEINSHSLFSKWFSESGKLVMKLFDEVKRLLENSKALVCVLIDEVESLAHARKSCTNGTEPSDSIRVVNALLTQLDQIKGYPNVMILTTSNVTEAIDLAFVDRADIKQYIGHPQKHAIYNIYKTCLEELMRTGLIQKSPICQVNEVEKHAENFHLMDHTSPYYNSSVLSYLSHVSVGLSGRTLRKMPFLTHAMYVRSNECTLATFLDNMERTIKKHKKDDCLEKLY